MTNLYTETLKALKDRGKSPDDIIWCGSESFGWFDWDTFKKISTKTGCNRYLRGENDSCVADDLLIVGADFWLELGVYEGRDYWAYRKAPKLPDKKRKPRRFIDKKNLFGDLESIN